MPYRPGALAHLERLFAAERESRLESMELAVLRLGTASGEAARLGAIAELSRHCHALKGAAQLEARVELCALVDMLERRAVQVAANTPDHSEVDTLLRAIATLYVVSRGEPAPSLVSDTIAELSTAVREAAAGA